MSKHSYDKGVLTPETPEDEHGKGDQILEEFTQANIKLSGRKRQRIEIDRPDSGDEEEEMVSKPAISGIIEKIELSNFMCHDHFEVEFGPQINFIIGHNGSGKSAILTAISVGLGAKANETNRGSSLKALIKNGCSSSRITIIFKNEGAGSYRPEVFGKKIIIQRILRIEGVNKYSIKSESNKHISDKKADLDAILSSFGISINNPMAILTQDAAKSFIATSSDEEKYKFFMAGTKADETIKNYHQTREELRKVKEKLFQLNADIRELKQTDSEARALFERYESQDELIKMKTLYQGKFLWVQVVEKEDKVLRAREGISNFTEEIQTAKEHVVERELRNAELEEHKEKIAEKMIEFLREKESREKELNDLRQKIKDIEREMKNAYADITSTEKEIEADTKKLSLLRKQVRDEQKKIDVINGGSHEQLNVEKEDLVTEIEVLNKKLNSLESDRLTIRDNFIDRKAQLSAEISSESKMKLNMERQLQQLKNSEGKRLDAFGKQVYALLNEIERDAGFHRKPLGPLGRYVNLKQGEESWSNILETALSKTLSSFIVQDQHDFQRLSNLFRKYKYRATIITRKYEVFDFKARSAPQEYKRITDVLSIEDPFVECLLVDLNNINRIILEKTRETAENVLRRFGANINSVLVPYDSRSGNSLKANKFGGLQIDVIRYRNDFDKIGSQGSSEERLTRFQQNLAKITRNIHTMEAEARNLRDEQISQEAEVTRKANDTKKKISRNERAINDINNKLEENANVGRLETLNEQITAITMENEIRGQQVIDCQYKHDEIRNKLHSEHSVYKEMVAEVRAMREFENDPSNDVTVIQNKIDTNVKEIGHYQNSIEKREIYIRDLLEYIEKESEAITILTENARFCCTREEASLKSDDTMESIEADKNKIETELHEFEKHIGMTREEVTNRFHKARNNYKSAQEKIRSVLQLKDSLQKSLEDRLMSFEQMRIDICNKVNDSFHKALMLRQFTGKILFDFERGKLTMMVSTKKNEKLRNIESFSGGEKSFSQISLLLAIWDFMNTRIRGLDEFDVFMDQVNRTLSLRLILEKMKESSSQTIFITPLDIAGTDGVDGRNVHIHRIADPSNI